jgi:ATP-dependent Clp protease ATP-binding subunit ClpC
MNMETSPNFTPKSQQIISDAKNLADSKMHEEVTCGHLLIVILTSEYSFINDLVRGFDLRVEEFIDFIEDFYSLKEEGDCKSGAFYGEDLKDSLSKAHSFAKKIHNNYIGVEHLFFSFLNESKGVCSLFFKSNSLTPSKILEAFLLLLQEQQSYYSPSAQPFHQDNSAPKKSPSAASLDPSSMLESFCVNLNELNENESLSNVIGKNLEIARICEILGRKIKNNVLLVGDPGVGKTAAVEGLVQRIGRHEAPPFLNEKQIYSVDLASMIAGTKYRGQFEQRIKALIKECREAKNIILFIDEMHTIVGAGSAEGAMDAANILKPALARGELTVIGATTFTEYKKNIEKDVALVRRFENVVVDEPSADECYKILKGIKKSYEDFHGVVYPNDVLKKIVSLCEDHLPTRRFPDKAIDILDECGSKLKINNSSTPQSILNIERELNGINPQVAGSEREEKLLNSYVSLNEKWEKSLRRKVNTGDVLECLASRNKVPKENFEHSNDKAFLSLGRKLNRDIVNQKHAVSDIHKAILRFKLGLKDANKPIGSFLCLGATGVGKTWTAKMTAKHYFGSRNKIIRFDMSEYSDKVSSGKLTGASPGYVGYEEGGVLVEAIKKTPHCVLLFDEIEKAHPEVQQLLLQMLEEGEIEDNMGTKVYFKDTIIILTSNIGSELTTKSSLGFSPTPISNAEKIYDTAKKILSPELVNRLDSVIIFNHLSEDDLLKIFKSEIKKLNSKLKIQKISLDIDDDVSKLICSQASEEKMGARPLKRLIKSSIEDPLVEHYFKKQPEKELKFKFFTSRGEVKYTVD